MLSNLSAFNQAKLVISGGVNSSARAFKAVRTNPPFFKKAEGAYLYDLENKKYIDYIGSWGPMILGHGHPKVLEAIQDQIQLGLSYGAPTLIETQMAEKIIELMPNIKMLRFTSSGTEAAMTAIRLARGATGRDKIIKFEGCYHGHADCLLAKAGSAALTLGVPSSPGVPESTTKDTLTAEFNNFEQISELFKIHPGQIAAIILEPIVGNMNFVRPQAGFLNHLRALCDQHGALLIMDEVMTGFRVALGGAQEIYKIKPDITCLGKIIGGGLPVGAIGGSRELMSQLTPDGKIFHSGTLSGNPVCMASGLSTLNILSQPGFFENLTDKTARLMNGFQAAADEVSIPFLTDYEGGMFGFYFTSQKQVKNLREITHCDLEQFVSFFNFMLNQGIYLACSAYEAGFMSSAHTDQMIDETIEKATDYFRAL